MPKTDQLAFRVREGVKPALVEAAAVQDRSLSWLVEHIITEWLVREGFLPASKPPTAPRKRPARLDVPGAARIAAT